MIIDLAIKNINSLPTDVLSMLGQILIEDQNHLKALEVFDKLKENTDDLKVKAGYLSALAEKDTKAASQYLKSLDYSAAEMETEEELHDLLEEPLATGDQKKKAKAKPGDIVESTKAGGKIFIPKAKTNKKVKYPKNFDPENPGAMPDPERWIPKWQRSKGKKKLRMKGPQGDVKNIGVHNKKEFSTSNMEVAGSGTTGRRKK